MLSFKVLFYCFFLGTGSVFLLYFIIRFILFDGYFYIFEFYKECVQKVEEEFKDYGFLDYVIVIYKDVCQFGFDLEDVVDVVFLDLLVLWDVLFSVKKVLKK